MAMNPAWISGTMGASAPPASITSASSRRIVSKASPMACPPVAQAETTAMFGPCAPMAMATWPVALSASMFDRKNGLRRRSAALFQHLLLGQQGRYPAHRRADDHAGARRVLRGDGVAAVGQRLLDGDHGELGVAVHMPHFFGVNRAIVEVLDFARQLLGIGTGVEQGDPLDAGAARRPARPRWPAPRCHRASAPPCPVITTRLMCSLLVLLR